MVAGKYSRYDEIERVIFTDGSQLSPATVEQIDEMFDELEQIARSTPEPVYLIVCWHGAGFADSSAGPHYGNRAARLLKLVRGVVRYAVTDPIARATLRTEMVRHLDEGTRSNIVNTKEEALALVRQLEAEERRRPRST